MLVFWNVPGLVSALFSKTQWKYGQGAVLTGNGDWFLPVGLRAVLLLLQLPAFSGLLSRAISMHCSCS